MLQRQNILHKIIKDILIPRYSTEIIINILILKGIAKRTGMTEKQTIIFCSKILIN